MIFPPEGAHWTAKNGPLAASCLEFTHRAPPFWGGVGGQSRPSSSRVFWDPLPVTANHALSSILGPENSAPLESSCTPELQG